jgi:carbonic anhydrase
VIDAKTYKLYNVHFHHPSEHTIEGKSFPMEAHRVNKADDGTVAVIGVMVVHVPRRGGISELVDKDHPGRMDATAAAFLPRSGGFYRYDGSLTTPPCGEGVIWCVMEHSIEMSAEQIAAFASVTGDKRASSPSAKRTQDSAIEQIANHGRRISFSSASQKLITVRIDSPECIRSKARLI